MKKKRPVVISTHKKKKTPRKRTPKNTDGLQLASRWRRGFFSIMFSRLGLVIIMLAMQFVFMLYIYDVFEDFVTKYFLRVQSLIQLIFLVVIINSRMNSTAKLPWALLIAIMPLFGTMFYLWTQVEMGHRTIRARLNRLQDYSRRYIHKNKHAAEMLSRTNPESHALAQYLDNTGAFPVYENTEAEYFPLGEDKYAAMLEELEKAEHFIFLEYFIIAEGSMWGNILELLAGKVKEGVEVRVLYDGTCELSTLPYDYPKRLAKLGIQCRVWEPIKPVITSAYNYRDHRKILVIDGKTGFCGGINLADEYINKISRYGHWKDTAVMLRGSAVDSLTLMFLNMWNVNAAQPEDFGKYLGKSDKKLKASGYIIPYADSPLNDHKIAERVYMDILNTAQKYVYIMTPYLILDDEMNTSLRYAAERGVDVRLILPGIPDKKLVWALAKRHYKQLIEAGVKIYEYTPGFVHAKVFVSDDIKAVVGTINLDYRSLYHHFECAAYMVDVPCIKDILADFRKTQSACSMVTEETIKNEGLMIKLTGAVLKLVAPLL